MIKTIFILHFLKFLLNLDQNAILQLVALYKKSWLYNNFSGNIVHISFFFARQKVYEVLNNP